MGYLTSGNVIVDAMGSVNMKRHSRCLVQDNHKGEWETISPCDCYTGGYCVLVSSVRGSGSGKRAYP